MIDTSTFKNNNCNHQLKFINIDSANFIKQNFNKMIVYLTENDLSYFDQTLAINNQGQLVLSNTNTNAENILYGIKQWNNRILRHHDTNEVFANKILQKYLKYLQKQIKYQRKFSATELVLMSEPRSDSISDEYCFASLYTVDTYADWIIDGLEYLTGFEINANYVSKSKIYPQLLLIKLHTLNYLDSSVFNSLIRIIAADTRNVPEIMIIKNCLKNLLLSNKIIINPSQTIDYELVGKWLLSKCK